MELRESYINNWATIVIAFCLLLLVIAKWIYKSEFYHLLGAAISNRYIKVSRNENPNHGLRIITVTVYTIGLALWITKLSFTEGQSLLDFKTFTLILTGLTIFILAKRYFSMMIASLMKFDEILELIEYHRNTYRAVLGILLIIVNLLIYYTFHDSIVAVRLISIVSIFMFVIYNFIILYTYSKSLLQHSFYFILYLCALETAPYLLLYKYIMLSRAY
ncbi:hypothetical protein JCM19275_2389 [Nonlabens ulvanivorans]|uniref:DUF4271 domain-containing protein n=1 Tax=Nonlabens ulvanivorans TaxID=906888 RepID=A0A090X199_NONUL|nr:DUF4271 domain-containing protein [Nonlabens ulvanivorans]GAL73542.1 hypothetical protein JCM19275_2389 [Nonlabens ulvanivorans]